MFKKNLFTVAAFVVAFLATISFLPDKIFDQRYLASAQAQSFTISGRVTDPPSGTGTGISGVTVSLVLNGGGTPLTTLTDAGGNFSFSGVAQGSNYDVTPSKTNYIFNPVSQGGTNLSSDRTLFFTGTTVPPTPTPTPTPIPTPTPTPTSDTIQFSALSYPVGEGDRQINLVVTRSGNTAAAASVGFATSDTAGAMNCNVLSGVASSRCDYEIRISTIRFAAGETSQTVSVFIIDDSYLEGAETFDVRLSNPSGGSLGALSTATVTITDNEIANGANPIDTTGFFVRLHYLDFFNREPDSSGLDFWTNQITS
ncbi:MAG: carboxypeptidase regulatory-like domain-containing protein [Pyrinomonadaceae bacterium]|nr:carboxypeptidase regulatory-like domain-containing protein [Pyrinomonadaceae bacterium]